MKPGLTRAVPMAILGFIIGALFVMVLRGLQGLDPLWNPQIGFIVAAFTTSGFFVWGMGGFNPEMNTHPHEPEVDRETGLILAEAHEEEVNEEDYPPARLFGYSLWQIAFWTIIGVVALAAVALYSGFFIQTSPDPSASAAAVGYSTIELPFFGDEVQLSQLTIFAGLIIFTLLSLAGVAALLAYAFYGLSSGVENAKVSAGMPFGAPAPNDALALPAPENAEAAAPVSQPNPLIARAIEVVRVVVMVVVLYLLFYYVLIGLILPEPELQLIVLSAVNAVVITLLVLYTRPTLRVVGRLAGGLANILRRVPTVLFQR